MLERNAEKSKHKERGYDSFRAADARLLQIKPAYTIELARNALECSENALIIAGADEHKWTIFISDDGPGVDPLHALNNSLNGGFGFREAFLFADTFVVEVFGRRYEKQQKALLYTGEGTVVHGTKIVFGKLFPTSRVEKD